MPRLTVLPLRRDGIAVLPLTLTASGTRSDSHLLDGLAHDVTSRLARLRSFHVIARGSSFALRNLSSDPQAAGRALGVAWTVTGTAEVLDDQFRLHLDLVDTESGATLWSEVLTVSRERFLCLLPMLTERIVHCLERQVTTAESRRALARPVESLDA